MHRSEVEGILQSEGELYAEPEGTTRARYEYSDGPHPGWKARGVIYLAGDVFTLFLSQLIFWPIELVIDASAERSADVIYDRRDSLLYFRAIKVSNREELIKLGMIPAPSMTPLRASLMTPLLAPPMTALPEPLMTPLLTPPLPEVVVEAVESDSDILVVPQLESQTIEDGLERVEQIESPILSSGAPEGAE